MNIRCQLLFQVIFIIRFHAEYLATRKMLFSAFMLPPAYAAATPAALMSFRRFLRRCFI